MSLLATQLLRLLLLEQTAETLTLVQMRLALGARLLLLLLHPGPGVRCGRPGHQR